LQPRQAAHGSCRAQAPMVHPDERTVAAAKERSVITGALRMTLKYASTVVCM
jgi:hypothetical protein